VPFIDSVWQGLRLSPPRPYHCFAVDIDSAAFVRFEEQTWECWRWDADGGLRKETKPND
jgi:hypothetical protein